MFIGRETVQVWHGRSHELGTRIGEPVLPSPCLIVVELHEDTRASLRLFCNVLIYATLILLQLLLVLFLQLLFLCLMPNVSFIMLFLLYNVVLVIIAVHLAVAVTICVY